MVADIKKSRFQHKLALSETKNIAENKIIALQHREILSESTVSVLMVLKFLIFRVSICVYLI